MHSGFRLTRDLQDAEDRHPEVPESSIYDTVIEVAVSSPVVGMVKPHRQPGTKF